MKLTTQTLTLNLIFLFMLAILLLRPVDDVDIFRVIKEGQLSLIQGKMYAKDVFTCTHYGDEVPIIGWLSQLIFGLLYNIGSWLLIQFFHVIIFSWSFIIWAKSGMCKKNISLFSLLVATFFGFIVAVPSSSIRPQSIGLFCFALFLSVLQKDYKLKIKFSLLIIISLIWQNSHPSLSVGIIAAIALFSGRWIEQLFKGDFNIPWPNIILIATFTLIQLATPMGWNIFRVSMTNTDIARNLLGISEWLPPWHHSIRGAMIPFWFVLIFSGMLLIKLRFKLSKPDLALFFSMTALSMYASRFTIFWAVAMIPSWARWIEKARPKNFFNFSNNVKVKKKVYFAVVFSSLILSISVPLFTRDSVIDKEIPMEGILQLKTLLPAGRIYNYREWGGPLVLEGYPRWKLAIDGRVYMFTRDEWYGYNNIALGNVAVEQVMKEHLPDAFFLRPSFHQNFINLLRVSPDWEEVYAAESSIIFLKKNS